MKKAIRIIIYVVSALVLIFIGAGIGSSGAKVTVHGESMTEQSLSDKISKEKNQLKSINDEYNKAKAVIAQRDSAQSELTDDQSKLKDIKGTLDKELASGKKDIDAKLASEKSQLSDVENQLSDKQKELASVSGQVQQAQSAPKILPAGRYIVGKDIPAGRYIATPTGQGSNFITYNTDGTPDVNTILGTDIGGVASYTFECTDDQTIQTEAEVKLTPIQ